MFQCTVTVLLAVLDWDLDLSLAVYKLKVHPARVYHRFCAAAVYATTVLNSRPAAQSKEVCHVYITLKNYLANTSI